MIPYNPPLRLQAFNRRFIVRDANNREIFEFLVNSRDIGYEKRMKELCPLVVDLMNGMKSIDYDNNAKSYDVKVHKNAPEPKAAFLIPGLKKLADGKPLDDGYKEPTPELSGAQQVALERGVKPEGYEVPQVVSKKRGRPKGS